MLALLDRSARRLRSTNIPCIDTPHANLQLLYNEHTLFKFLNATDNDRVGRVSGSRHLLQSRYTTEASGQLDRG